MEEPTFALNSLSPDDADVFIRLMKQSSFTLELQEEIFKKEEITPSVKQKLRDIGTDIVHDLILPIFSRQGLHPYLGHFITTLKSHIYKNATSQTNVIVFKTILTLILRLMDKSSPMKEMLIKTYQAFDPCPMPFIFHLLESEDEQVVESAASALKNFTVLFYLKNDEVMTGGLNHYHSEGERSSFTDVFQFLQQLDVDLIDPGEILGCTATQMRKYFPIFFTLLEDQLKKEHSSSMVVRGWNAFLQRVHMDPYLSQMFYWMAMVYKLIPCRVLQTELHIFLTSQELFDTQAFFEGLNQDWFNNNIILLEEKETHFIDPLSENCNRVVKWQVLKVFASKANPLLLEFKYSDGTSNFAICKKGDDLRQDYYVQTIFMVFNELWASETKLELKPYIYTYKCVPLSDNFGLIECVQNVESVENFNWETLKQLDENGLNQFICSLAGSYLASFVLGIRDRHQDNMLVKNGYIFFHIDFGHLWNNKPLADAPRIAVPDKVKSTLTSEEWKRFIKVLFDGFAVLHKYGKEIQNAVTTLFRQVTDPKMISAFLESEKSLMINLSLPDAISHFDISLDHSLRSVGKKINVIKHTMGTLGRSSGSSPRPQTPSKRTRSSSTQPPRCNSANSSPYDSPVLPRQDKPPPLPPTTPNRRGSITRSDHLLQQHNCVPSIPYITTITTITTTTTTTTATTTTTDDDGDALLRSISARCESDQVNDEEIEVEEVEDLEKMKRSSEQER